MGYVLVEKKQLCNGHYCFLGKLKEIIDAIYLDHINQCLLNYVQTFLYQLSFSIYLCVPSVHHNVLVFPYPDQSVLF